MDSTTRSALFQPIQIGPYTLQHRIVLAPLTRLRCTKDNLPQKVMAEYYSQRGSIPGTLLVSEATLIAQKAGQYLHAPGIWSDAQMEGWKKVTEAVHAKGSFIFLQLWALGHAADDPFASASGIPIPSSTSDSRSLTKDEIQEYIQLYSTAASNAVYKSGFDGVEIHASGTLIDQFLQDVSNDRTDDYGGPLEKRCKFALEVAKAVAEAVGEERTGMRIGVWVPYQGMGMTDPVPTFTYLVSKLKELYPWFAYLHVIEPATSASGYGEVTTSISNDFIRDIWLPRPLISAGRYNRETAMKVAESFRTRFKSTRTAEQAELRGGELIAFGKAFLANPDLPTRLKKDLPLNKYDKATFYIPGDASGKGYTDYPSILEITKNWRAYIHR
ncbi:NADH:flavin oxidoreductase/NADH oxidase [Gymnopus androsaceus JB14]|uniref:NADH:flavin oxidoreductase/NADH oxidase n=1 Tax=Gymnopus androsaceus JB14 TaxID=1447944 RepID=A0A6A4IE10_9AGAR|nr:NADH:flavin oxidoreductase/NADH oxidase [Gymnopus androsaceus JB14]